jgi:hypothetical protein
MEPIPLVGGTRCDSNSQKWNRFEEATEHTGFDRQAF